MSTILLVEDNPHIMKINSSCLSMEDYSVLEAADAAQCRYMLSNNDVDLVILDIMLPDGDGISLCREIKAKYDIPILFLSALSENDDIITALRAGGDDYLPKPYDIQVLIARVEARLRSVRKDKRYISFGRLRLDTVSMAAYFADNDLLTTQKEFSILLMLPVISAVQCRKPSFMRMCGICRIPTTQMHCSRRFHGLIKNSMITKPM